jgi:eukaryotic-like serine/threonine-protein kinase
MSLAAGTSLGPFEVLSPLGAGRMGEVYRARDAKLGRDVAIKVLPEAVAGDGEPLARFQREAVSGGQLLPQATAAPRVARDELDGRAGEELRMAS